MVSKDVSYRTGTEQFLVLIALMLDWVLRCLAREESSWKCLFFTTLSPRSLGGCGQRSLAINEQGGWNFEDMKDDDEPPSWYLRLPENPLC